MPKIKKIILLGVVLLISNKLFAQLEVEANFELLYEEKINNFDSYSFEFYTNEYESYSPLGPLIDNRGFIRFFDFNNFVSIYNKSNFVQKKNETDLVGSLTYLNAVSNNGICLNQSMRIYICKDDNCKLYMFPKNKKFTSKYIVFRDGVLFIEKNIEDSFLISFENNSPIQIEYSEISNWLQKRNYKLVNDKIYYNNQVYASFSEKWFNNNSIYGRLKNNYIIIPIGKYNSPSEFAIRPFDGDNELIVKLNYTLANNCDNFVVSWGIGNYGEIYILQGPDLDSHSIYYNPINKDVKLFVIRNHLKYFGILNDDKIRLRKGPGTNTESLGTYQIKTGFRILENSGVKQTIGGVTDEWIKVRLLDGTEGYFFGQYVQNLYDGPGTPLPWPNVPDWD
ncbi:MAG: SH3 domain-containing protein [Treponema sp.]|nr:SH3 domain-containing protein [Treponema sp.]